MSEKMQALMELAWEVFPGLFGIKFVWWKPGHEFLSEYDRNQDHRPGQWMVAIGNGWDRHEENHYGDTMEDALLKAIQDTVTVRQAKAEQKVAESDAGMASSMRLAAKLKRVTRG